MATSIVIEFGTTRIRAGFAINDYPTIDIPNCLLYDTSHTDANAKGNTEAAPVGGNTTPTRRTSSTEDGDSEPATPETSWKEGRLDFDGLLDNPSRWAPHVAVSDPINLPLYNISKRKPRKTQPPSASPSGDCPSPAVAHVEMELYRSIVAFHEALEQILERLLHDPHSPQPPGPVNLLFTEPVQPQNSPALPPSTTNVTSPSKSSRVPWFYQPERLLVEIFEDTSLCRRYKIAGVQLAKQPVLSCFAQGRTSGLVIDCGHSGVRVSPVLEGSLLLPLLGGSSGCGLESTPAGAPAAVPTTDLAHSSTEAIQISDKIGGERLVVLGEQMLRDHAQEASADDSDNTLLVPLYATIAPSPALASVHPSFHRFKVKQLLEEFISSVAEVSSEPIAKQQLTLPKKSFEFPCRRHKSWSNTRYLLAESLFAAVDLQTGATISSSSSSSSSSAFTGSLPGLVETSMSFCDDYLKQTFANVILCGGCSLLPGFTERLQKELTAIFPASNRVRLYTFSTKKERMWSSWLGGSALVSLEHFQKLWIQKRDYEGLGPSVLHKKRL